MNLALAYVGMILIWASTPLVMQAAMVTLSPAWAALLRTLLGVVLGMGLILVRRERLPLDWPAIRTYLYGCINVCLGMFLTFNAAHHLVSGMICVIFGLSPVFSALLSRSMLEETPLAPLQWVSVLLGLTGLAVVFSGHLDSPVTHVYAVVAAVCAVMCFCLGNVLLKRQPANMPALQQTTGTLLLAVPMYVVLAAMAGGEPSMPGPGGVVALLYLGVFGSLIAVMCQYFVLSRVSSATIALSTFVTPPIALALGRVLNHDVLLPAELMGTACIMAALVFYFWGGGLFRAWRKGNGNEPV